MTIALLSLDKGRDAVHSALREALQRLDPTSRDQSAYHLGFTDADGSPSATGGGKAVRPALALLSAEAAGAPPEKGVPGAVAVELVHNFSLVHDDLIDGDLERRHRPTVWSVWGASSAILTGDALLGLALEVLLDVGTADAAKAARMLTVTVRELIRGQVDDVAFERRQRVGLDQSLSMAAGKTGSLLATSAAIGAVLGGAPRPLVAGLETFGAELGLAFQLVDDVLGIWGDPAVTGKPVYSDLRSRKKSLPVTYAVTHGGAAGRELHEWLNSSGDHDEAAYPRAADLVEAGGGRAWADAEAQRRLAAGIEALEAVRMPEPVRAELIGLAEFIVHREA
jgi:geranylgeranyl diphosphate synthase type I